ncbi:MAG: SPASM domain-containing protein [Candidatus Hodarchaeota archaeon]
MIFKNNYIHELELNFSNSCGAKCIMCSEPHGCDGESIMSRETFDVLKKQLKDVKCDIIQSSGDGETFHNPNYLDFIEELKQIKPDTPIWIYNNFSEFTQERIDRVLANNYFEKIHTRIDSLIPWIFEKSSNLNFETVIENIKYFLSQNNRIPFVVLYNRITDYYDRCEQVTGKRPIRDRFTDFELAQVPDEMKDITNFLKSHAKNPDLIAMCKISHGLWGERYRNDIEHNSHWPCPKANVIEKVCWVYPNGKIGMCCYEDRQNPEWALGDIRKQHILDIFYGEKRMDTLKKIKNLQNVNPFYNYPCNNPRMCGFNDGVEAKP